MQCIRPIKASFDSSGSITYSSRKAIPGLVGFAFECRKCLPCRLNIAREKSVRAIHESTNYKNNIFLTLTYNEESLKSPKLQYLDFQLFMKRLRKYITKGITCPDLKKEMKISYMVTGEYGDKNKRPHWHAIIFNYSPSDSKPKYTTELGEEVYTSKILHDLWTHGNIEFGSVTLESAGYVARYAAKKLAHGKDQDHDYHPIHKTSSKHALGKPWIEKYWKQTFRLGYIRLPNGQKSKIPRYYVDWLKKNNPDEYLSYVTHVRPQIQQLAEEQNRLEEVEFLSSLLNYQGETSYPLTRPLVKLTILKQKFKALQERLKL